MSEIYEISAAPHFPQEMKTVVQSISRDGLKFEGVEYGLICSDF